MKMRYFLSLAFLAFAVNAEIIIPKAKVSPRLDGVLAQGEWPEPMPFPFKKVVTMKETEDKTQVRMQYDDEYIYVALSNPTEHSSTNAGVFSQPRYELRFGKLPEFKVFAVTLDGRYLYPSDGWNAVTCKSGVMEIRIPLKLISGYRIYFTNIVRDNGSFGTSMFPIPKPSYHEPDFMRKIYLGTPKEIAEAEKKLFSDEQTFHASRLEFCKQFAGRKSPALAGAKAKSFQIGEEWKPYKFFTGKDFHFMFIPQYGKMGVARSGTQFVPNNPDTIPLFQDAAYQVHAWYLDRGFRDKAQPIGRLLKDPDTNPSGYILKKTSNPILFESEGGYNTFEKEVNEKKENLEAFVKQYGHRLLGLTSDESLGPNGGFPMMCGLAKMTPASTKAEAYEQLRKLCFDPARTYIRDWAVFYPELAPFRSPLSCTHTDHIYLSYGFGMAGQEYGPHPTDMALAHCVSRGAARQYGKPFRYYLTVHDDKLVFPGCENNHRNYSLNDYRFALRPGTRKFGISKRKSTIMDTGPVQVIASACGPNYGVPKDDWRRCFIYTYMAGGNMFFDECGHWLMYANYNWKTIDKEDPLAVNLREPKKHLSDMGERMADFYDRIVCKEDRGVVYAPIALMWDLHHGYFSNYTGSPWGCINLTEGDRMMGAVEGALFPRSERIYNNRGFRTGPFGDIFDVITNDASAKVLENYPVLMFCGDVPVDAALAKKLVDYTRKGGTLVVNWKQIEPFASLFPPDFLGAELSAERRKAKCSYSTFSGKALLEEHDFFYTVAKLRKGAQAAVFTGDERQDPLVVVSDYGKGKVIFSTPDFLKEPYTSRMLKIFYDLMAALRDQTLPLKVEGDVQYMVHRNSKGWVVSLFNNYGSGFNRSWDNPQHRNDPKYDVTVAIKPGFKYKSVREWFTGDKSLTVKVPAGDVRIVEIVK